MRKSIFNMAGCAFLSTLMLLSGTNSRADDKREVESMIPIVVKLIGSGQLEEAGRFLAKGEKLDPENDAIQYYKGMLLITASSKLQNQNSKEMVDLLSAAAQCFAKAAVADSSNLWYKRRLGNLMFMLKQDRTAYDLYSAILKKSPYDTETIARLADVCINLGMYEKADSLITVVEKIEGENGLTQLSRLELLRQQGDYNVFFSALQRFVGEPTIGPADKCDIIGKFISSNTLSFNYNHLSDYDALVQRCMDVYPGDTSVMNFAAQVYFSIGQHDRTLAICGDKPATRSLAYLRFASHITQKDYAAANSDCDILLTMVGNNAVLLSDIHCNKADCLQYSERTADAYREYKLALKLNPGNIVALNNYAYLMSCNGKNLSKCETMIMKVIEAEPENPTYLDTYGWILHKRKKNGEAKAVFKKAMLFGGKDHAEILYHYAEVLDALGEASVAEAYRAQARLKE